MLSLRDTSVLPAQAAPVDNNTSDERVGKLTSGLFISRSSIQMSIVSEGDTVMRQRRHSLSQRKWVLLLLSDYTLGNMQHRIIKKAKRGQKFLCDDFVMGNRLTFVAFFGVN